MENVMIRPRRKVSYHASVWIAAGFCAGVGLITPPLHAATMNVTAASDIDPMGSRTIGRDAINPGSFGHDLASGVSIVKSTDMESAGAKVLDFETSHGWATASVTAPANGDILTSTTSNPFASASQAPVTQIKVGSITIDVTAANFDSGATTKTLAGMITAIDSAQSAAYLVADNGDSANNIEPVTISGNQGLIAAKPRSNDAAAGILLTFSQGMRSVGAEAFNRSTAGDGDNNYQAAAFDVNGNYLGRYSLPAGGSPEAGGNGLPDFVGIKSDAATIKYLYIGHYSSATARNLVFDDVSFVPAPEPGSLALLGLGGVMMLTRKRRQR